MYKINLNEEQLKDLILKDFENNKDKLTVFNIEGLNIEDIQFVAENIIVKVKGETHFLKKDEESIRGVCACAKILKAASENKPVNSGLKISAYNRLIDWGKLIFPSLDICNVFIFEAGGEYNYYKLIFRGHCSVIVDIFN